MAKIIFDYIGEKSINNPGASVSYEVAKEKFGLSPEEFQEIAKNYSHRYDWKFKITKDGIIFS